LALERQDIEKRDFPIGRRGYDPDAVDRHLREIAEEVAELREQAASPAPRGGASLAVASSDQVRTIVEAAESSAAGITREAEDRAGQIRQQAAEEADKSRTDAAHQAREHVAKVSEATSVMLQRVDAMEGELGALVESLRTGANRLNADLALLQGNMGELRASATGSGEAAVVEEALEEEAAEAALEPEPEPEPVAAEPEPEPELVEEKEPTVEEPSTSGDSEGARLIALNMALNGTPREETDRYLAENFDITDRAALLDEVYARVG
jgi:DivIVA domain-containing protein